MQGKSIDAGVPAAIESGKGLFVAGHRLAQQRFITDLGAIRHAALIQGLYCAFPCERRKVPNTQAPRDHFPFTLSSQVSGNRLYRAVKSGVAGWIRARRGARRAASWS